MQAVRRTLLMTAALAVVPCLAQTQVQQAQPANPTSGLLSVTSIKNDAAVVEFNAGMEDFWLLRHKSAVAHFTKALELEPHFGLARAARAIQLGGPTEAAELQTAFTDASAGSAAEAIFALGIREFGATRAGLARQALSAASTMFPSDRNVALWNAWAMTDTARLNALRSLGTKYPDFAPAKTWLAFYLVPIGVPNDSIVAANGDEAMQAAMAAVRLNPRESTVHSLMAHVLLAQHKYDEAAQHATAATNMMPKDPYAYQIRAQLAALDGNQAAIRSALDSAMAWTTDVNQNNTYARARAMTFLSEGNAARAQAELLANAKDAEDRGIKSDAALAHMFAAIAAGAARDTTALEAHFAAARNDGVADGVRLDYMINAYGLAGQGAKARALMDEWNKAAAALPPASQAVIRTRDQTTKRHEAFALLGENKPKEALAVLQQGGANPYRDLGELKALLLLKNGKGADSAQKAFLARKDFSYASSATPAARFLTVKK